jgi:aconitate hydratase
MASLDSFKCRRKLTVGDKTYDYFSLVEAEKNGLEGISKLPYSMRVLLENLLRFEDGRSVTKEDILACKEWLDNKGKTDREIAYRPARVLMQDFTGVPAVVDLAAMRDAMAARRRPAEDQPAGSRRPRHRPFGDRRRIRLAQGLQKNVELEFERNGERYAFLKWGQQAFRNFRVVPPGTGICHQVNLEYLAQTVWTRSEKNAAGNTVEVAYPDTLVGTDSHTTMVNGLAVLGWGVGGIEAEAAMLGQPQSMLMPEVIGFKLTGRLTEGVTATDLVLTVTQMLRKKGVVNKFVEFFGPGLDAMTLADRATIANMAPEYGATCGFFPIDGETLNYLRTSGRDAQRIALVQAYAQGAGHVASGEFGRSGVHRHARTRSRLVVPSMAGPKRPEGRVADRREARLPRRARRRVQEGRRRGEGGQGRGQELRDPPWRRGDRRHHLLHQHLQSERADRGGPARPQRRGQRACAPSRG